MEYRKCNSSVEISETQERILKELEEDYGKSREAAGKLLVFLSPCGYPFDHSSLDAEDDFLVPNPNHRVEEEEDEDESDSDES